METEKENSKWYKENQKRTMFQKTGAVLSDS
jgi:hypothetical protein